MFNESFRDWNELSRRVSMLSLPAGSERCASGELLAAFDAAMATVERLELAAALFKADCKVRAAQAHLAEAEAVVTRLREVKIDGS